MSYKYEVLPVNESKFVANGMRFATEAEAEAYGRDLGSRWLGFTEGRVAESDDPVNYKINMETMEMERLDD